MTDCVGVSGRLLALALICAVSVSTGHAANPEPAPQWLAYCVKLYSLWNRYGHHPTFHHTGQRARAELALHRCQNGEFVASVETLDVVLEHNLVAIPPAPDIPPTPQFAFTPH
ncbi:hypothetical protein [Reyranella sp.]|uniref:hypothetical protein n=1 Tax=Reyranella sp. TaxID=1929291 RepID=UPI00378522B1